MTEITVSTFQRGPYKPLAFARSTNSPRNTRHHARHAPPQRTGGTPSVHSTSRPSNPASASRHHRAKRPLRPTSRRALARNGANRSLHNNQLHRKQCLRFTCLRSPIRISSVYLLLIRFASDASLTISHHQFSKPISSRIEMTPICVTIGLTR